MSQATTQQVNFRDWVKANSEFLCDLYARWQDEKQYEDINDYGKAISKVLPEGVKVIKSTKRPFGVVLANEAGVKVHLTINSTGINWKTIK